MGAQTDRRPPDQAIPRSSVKTAGYAHTCRRRFGATDDTAPCMGSRVLPTTCPPCSAGLESVLGLPVSGLAVQQFAMFRWPVRQTISSEFFLLLPKQ